MQTLKMPKPHSLITAVSCSALVACAGGSVDPGNEAARAN